MSSLPPGGEEKLNPLAGGKVMHKSRARWVGAELHVEWSMEREGQKFIWGSDVRSLQDSATQRLERHVRTASPGATWWWFSGGSGAALTRIAEP